MWRFEHRLTRTEGIKKWDKLHRLWPFASVLHSIQWYNCSCSGKRWRTHTCCSLIIAWKKRSVSPMRGRGERCSWKLVLLGCSTNTTSTEQDLEILDDADKFIGVGDSISSFLSAAWSCSDWQLLFILLCHPQRHNGWVTVELCTCEDAELNGTIPPAKLLAFCCPVHKAPETAEETDICPSCDKTRASGPY